MQTFYDVLGVSSDAKMDIIRGRYRFLVMAYHPDRFTDEKGRIQAEEEMKKINAAFEVISDPVKRDHYDNQLGISSRKSSNPSASTPPSQSSANSGDQSKGSKDSDASFAEFQRLLGALLARWEHYYFPTQMPIQVGEAQRKFYDHINELVQDRRLFSQFDARTYVERAWGFCDKITRLNFALGAELRSNPKSIPYDKTAIQELSSFPLIEILEEMLARRGYSGVGTDSLRQKLGSEIKLVILYAEKWGNEFSRSMASQAKASTASTAENSGRPFDARPNGNQANPPRPTYYSNQPQNSQSMEAYKTHRKATILVLGVFGVLFLLCALVSSLNGSKGTNFSRSDTNPQSAGPLITIYASTPNPAEGQNPISTNPKFVNPAAVDYTPTPDCRTALSITTSEVGRNLCVYGIVKKAYFGENTYFITFSDDTYAFRLIVLNGYYFKDVQGNCVRAVGIVKNYGSMPYIEVDNTNLYHCN